MKMWQRRMLGILALGGSFLGASLALAGAFSPGLSFFDRAFVLAFFGLYLWGIWCGLRMIEGDLGAVRSNRIFWAMQIPYFSSSFAGYFFASGALAFVTLEPFELRIGAFARLGSQFQFSINRGDEPFVIGLNLFAVAMVVFITRHLAEECSSSSFVKLPAND